MFFFQINKKNCLLKGAHNTNKKKFFKLLPNIKLLKMILSNINVNKYI